MHVKHVTRLRTKDHPRVILTARLAKKGHDICVARASLLGRNGLLCWCDRLSTLKVGPAVARRGGSRGGGRGGGARRAKEVAK